MKNSKIQVVILIVTFALILSTIQTCNNNKYQQLVGEKEVLQKQYDAQKDVVTVTENNRLKLVDSINKEIEKREQVTKTAKEKIKQLQNQIDNRKKELKPNMTFVEIASDINEIYQTNQATSTNNSVDLKGDLPQRILENVYDANECQDIFKMKDEQMAYQDTIIQNLEKDKQDISLKLFSIENSLEEHKKLIKSGEENLENQKKQIKKLKTKNFISKYIVPPLIFTGGFLAGQQLLK